MENNKLKKIKCLEKVRPTFYTEILGRVNEERKILKSILQTELSQLDRFAVLKVQATVAYWRRTLWSAMHWLPLTMTLIDLKDI